MKATFLAVAVAVPLVVWPTARFTGPREVEVECATVLGSEVCAWVVTDGAIPSEVGASIPLALIESVPEDVEMVWPPQPLVTIPLPEAARTGLGLDHLTVNWEAHGHPPASFLVQHFDFHFYSVSEAEVAAIDCADESKPARLPQGYALPDIEVPEMGRFVGLCVPRMGMHAMPSGEVDAEAPFEATMMLGYYGAEPIFVEPMISRARLLERRSFALDVPEVAGLPDGVSYPLRMRAEYDPSGDRYLMSFDGFESR